MQQFRLRYNCEYCVLKKSYLEDAVVFFALDSNKLAAPEAAPVPKYLFVLFVID